MVKLVCFLTRNPKRSRAEFLAHWRDRHGPLIAGTPDLSRHIVRYEQNPRADSAAGSFPGADFDGCTVQWFESMEDFGGFLRSPQYQELVVPDERHLLDMSGLGLLFTGETRAMIGDASAKARAGRKLLCLLARRPGLTPEDFHRHWGEVHGPLVRDTPELARHLLAYEQNDRLLSDYEREDGGGWDGFAELWFESDAELRAFFSEPAYREKITPDEDRLIDRERLAVLVTEPAHVVIEGPAGGPGTQPAGSS